MLHADAFAARRSPARLSAFLLCALTIVTAGCARNFPNPEVTKIKAASPVDLQRYLLSQKPDVSQFRFRGPFAVTEHKDIEIPLASGRTIEGDLYMSAGNEKAPLVIVLHGFGNSKEDHAFQAMHVASWGMHGLAIDLPNHGPWITHGRTLVQLVDALRKNPALVDARIDADRIVLAGHSFGATAVASALGNGAHVVGGVLLDPAGIGRELPQLLRRIKVPVMIVGADEDIWPTRNRAQFYRYIPGSVGEISIRDSVHEDAQYPNEHTSHTFEEGPADTEEAQITFVSALTASAFGLASTGTIDFAWNSFEKAVEKGTFFNTRRK